MSAKLEFKIERYEEYYGDTKQVKKIIDECKLCGAKLIHSHISDYRNLMIQETSQCLDCGAGSKKMLHILN
jgi:hypothetical protein